MRQSSKNNRQRGRGRRNGNGQINRNTTLDSNGPDVRLRGNAFQLYEKYVSLGNDASASGERISAEAYYQHADHYFRVHSAIVASQEERRNGHAENGAANGAAKETDSAETVSEQGDSETDSNAAATSADANADSDPSDVANEDKSAEITSLAGEEGEEVSQQAG